MRLWMLGAVALLLAAVYLTLLRFVRENRARQKESENFLSEANDLMGTNFDEKPAQVYREKKQLLFDSFKAAKKWDDARLDESCEGEPEDAWQRELAARDLAPLKAALLKRTISVLPLMQKFQQDAQSKFNLLQRGLISDKQWAKTLELRNSINHEAMEIRHEAECLLEGYGFGGVIFKEASTFHEHEIAKKREEMMRSTLMNAAMAQGMNRTDAERAVNAKLREVHSNMQKSASTADQQPVKVR